MEIPLISMEGLMPVQSSGPFLRRVEGVGLASVPEAVFGLEPSSDLISRMVVYQLARRRAGTHCARSRSDVSRTGRKSVRQKGSGGARHGSRRVNIFRGGGKAFGPVVRSHAIKLPKKVRGAALRHALSAKSRGGMVFALDVDRLVLGSPSTKAARQFFGRCLPPSGRCVVYDGLEVDQNVRLAVGNVPLLTVLSFRAVNVYDVMRHERIIFTQGGLMGFVTSRYASLVPSLDVAVEG